MLFPFFLAQNFGVKFGIKCSCYNQCDYLWWVILGLVSRCVMGGKPRHSQVIICTGFRWRWFW